jgi:hypothetical protein
MQVMANGRVRRSAAERREVISRWEKSGLKPAQFCRREQIRLSSFRRWRHNGQAGSGKSEFLELTTPLPAPSSWTLEISLPNGCHVRFQG